MSVTTTIPVVTATAASMAAQSVPLILNQPVLGEEASIASHQVTREDDTTPSQNTQPPASRQREPTIDHWATNHSGPDITESDEGIVEFQIDSAWLTGALATINGLI